MAPLYRVRIKYGASFSGKDFKDTVYHGRFKDGTFASGMDERWRLYIGYGLKMAPFYMVRIKDGASILGTDLRWHLCIWLESGMD